MDWIKHYGKASMDPRMEKVIDDMGCFGVGLYWRLCERIECWGNGSYSREQLVRELKGRRLNSRHIHAMLDKYGLFITSPDGYVSLAPIRIGCMKNENKSKNSLSSRESPQTPQPSSKEKGTDSLQPSVGAEPMSREPSVDVPQGARVRKREEEKTEKKNKPLPDWTFPYREYPWFPYLAQLLDSDNTVWKEVVCMQSGYTGLLMQHWENAVRQFTLHIIAYDTAKQIQAPEEARYYFNSFVKLSSKSGQALKTYLGNLYARTQPSTSQPSASDKNPYRYEELVNGIRYADGRPVPSTAPPRPSPTTVWNDSCDAWSNFYDP